MEHYISLMIKSIFIENILLAYFLGMCSFLACSKRVDTSFGLGFAVIFVLAFTTPINWMINYFLLKPNALVWAGIQNSDLSFLRYILYISVIAAFVHIAEMIIDKFIPSLHNSLGIFLPLIAVNCAILGASLFVFERNYNFTESVVFGISSGIGWTLAILLMSAIRKKMGYCKVPKALEGIGIIMILTGLMSMVFMCFSGIKF